MATIYCSQKLTTLLGLPKKSKVTVPDASDPNGWNGMLFYLNKRKCLLFIHKSTLYCFVVFDIVKKDLINFDKFFRQHLTDQLFTDQLISEKTKALLEKNYENIVLKPTDNDKCVIGSMNDCIYRIRFYDDHKEDSLSLNSTFIGHQLDKTPMGGVDYAFPVDLMKEYIEKISRG